MNPKSNKITGLVRQYPFIQNILDMFFRPQGTSNGRVEDDVTIRVARADGDLMYRQASNMGFGDHSFLFATGGGKKDMVGRRLECLIAIDANGSVFDTLYWPNNDQEKRGKPELYAKAIFWGKRNLNTGWCTEPVWEKIEQLVWASGEAWHEDTERIDEPESRFGVLRSRSVNLTIYGKPEGGFEKLDRGSSPERNLRLTNRVIMAGTSRKDTEIIRLSGMVDELGRQFGEEVFSHGMKNVLDEGNVRGASGELGPVKALCAELSGCDRIMLEDAVSRITLQGTSNSGELCVVGMDGTVPQLRALVRGAIRAWSQPEMRAAFKPDGGIHVM